jgi:DNA polymerase III delta prime subunit
MHQRNPLQHQHQHHNGIARRQAPSEDSRSSELPSRSLGAIKSSCQSLHPPTFAHKSHQKQAQSGDFPHLLVYGPSGAGKKTRIVATLKELYGPGVEKIKIDARVFQTTSNRKLEFNIVASVYHLEITPSDVGNYDRVVIQDLLKEVAQTQQLDLAAKQRFKVVVINEADHLTRDAQAALRRTMEKYSPNLRLILLANSTSNIIAPIRSRTLLVRVAAPSEDEICAVLRVVGKKEQWEEFAEGVVDVRGGARTKVCFPFLFPTA